MPSLLQKSVDFPLLLSLLLLPALLAGNSGSAGYREIVPETRYITAGSDPQQLEQQLRALMPESDLYTSDLREYALQRLQTYFQGLEQNRISRKPLDKALELIRQEAERQFFRQSAPFASFADLFDNGTYSTPTAVALYALTFEYFDIPYAASFSHEGLSIIVQPSSQPIPFLAVADNNQPAHLQYNLVTSYLDLLKATHLLPRDEWNRPAEQLFQRYFLATNERMSIRQLAALIHYQMAVHQYSTGNYLACMEWLDKARQGSTQLAFQALERAALVQLAHQSNDPFSYLLRLWSDFQPDWLATEILRQFEQRLLQACSQNPAAPEAQPVIDEFYRLFRQSERHRQEIDKISCSIITRHHARQQQQAIDNIDLEKLYSYCPHDQSLQQALIDAAMRSIRSRMAQRDTQLSFDAYRERYPFIIQNADFKDFDLQQKAQRIHYCFSNNQIEEGHRLLTAFERTVVLYKTAPRLSSWVTTAYATASQHYFLLREYSMARSLLETANRLAPGDAYLEDRLALLRRY
jgi:hypothetical protein